MADETTILDHGRNDLMRAKLELDTVTDAVEVPDRGRHFEVYLTNLPEQQLVAMFSRVKLALHAWMEVMDHLRPA
jgi:hypothetical protein